MEILMHRLASTERLESLADVLDRLRDDEAAHRAHANIFSAIRTVGRVLERPLGDIPAHADVLRALLMHAKPDAHGIGPTRWANVRSSLNQALRTTGILRDNYCEPCSAAWEDVASRAGTIAECSAIRRLGRFCTMLDIAPADLSDAVIADYGAYLGERQLSKTPQRIAKDAIRLCNRLAKRSPELALPTLCVEACDRNYALRWEALPAALASDARRFYENAVTPDWFEEDVSARTVRKTTADQRDRMLRRLASAEILAGVSASSLHALADVVRADHLRLGLDFMIKRAGGQPNKQVFEMAHLALTIARNWAKASDEEITQLDRWARRFRPVKRGMTDKNRARLQQFSNGQTIARLVNLPEQIFATLSGLPVTPMNARKAQRALILAILTAAPIRLANLRALDRHRHFQPAPISGNSF